jgi:hypothetical protein
MGYKRFSLKDFPRTFSPKFALRRRKPPILEGEGAGLFIGRAAQFLIFCKKFLALIALTVVVRLVRTEGAIR